MSITILELANHILGRQAETGADFERVGLPMIGGCEVCHATVAAYNACPSRSGYLRCADGCIDDLGYNTVEEANQAIFGL